MYLPGDINGLARKLQLLAAEFFAGDTTVRNELVHVLDALLRLKQLTRKEYTHYRSHSSIIMIVYKSTRFAVRRYQYGGMQILISSHSLLYLFNSLKLTLAGQEVEHINYPGHATSLLGLASYSSDYQRGCGLAQCWLPDTGLTVDLNANAGFKTRHSNEIHIRFYG